MALQTKIIIINIVLAIIITLGFAFGTDTWPGNGFFLMLAFITGCGGAGALAIGLLLLFKKDKRVAKAYLTSGILFLAVSTISFFLLQQY